MLGAIAVILMLGFLAGDRIAYASEITSMSGGEAVINAADTGFMLICSALVLLMTPGLAFFYGGLVRSRNVLNTMMMSFVAMAIVSITWIIWGYSLAFDNPGLDLTNSHNYAQGIGQFIGGINWIFLNGVTADQTVAYAGTIPHILYMFYQMTFAIITCAIISGSIVERVSFKAYFWFILLWSIFIYPILAHWVWGRGWIHATGALDFAGGTVVHISSGVAGLTAAWVIGPRKNYPSHPHTPHNIPFVMLGIAILWFGWTGFNGGSALAASPLAATAFVNTMIAAMSAGFTWVILEWVLRGKPTAIGIATGFLAGLVAITPAAGFVNILGAILMASITSVCCFYSLNLRAKLEFDDSLDAYFVHGVGGTIGALLTGILATTTVNSSGSNGLLFGNPQLLWIQLIGVVGTYILVALGTFIILKGMNFFMDLRVKPEIEEEGLDLNQHGEEAYGQEFSMGLGLKNSEK